MDITVHINNTLMRGSVNSAHAHKHIICLRTHVRERVREKVREGESVSAQVLVPRKVYELWCG